VPICVYTLSAAELARRLVPRYQRAALAPFPSPREHPAPWGLNRIPGNFRDLTEEGWTELKLRDTSDKPPPAAREPATPAAPRAPAAPARGTVFCPRQMGFVLTHDSAAHVAGIHAARGPTIPWPFRITGCVSMISPLTTNVSSWGLRVIHPGMAAPVGQVNIGETLFEERHPGSADGLLANGQIYLDFSASGSVTAVQTQSLGTALVGREINDGNRQILFVVGTGAGATVRARVAITIEEICVQPIEARPQSTPVSRPAAAPSPAPRPAAAPPRPPEPRPQAHTSFGARGAVWGPGGGNPQPWRGTGVATSRALARGGG